MDKINILIGCPLCQEPLILKEFLVSLLNININGLNVDFLFIDDNNIKESKELLRLFNPANCKVDIIDMQNSKEYVRTDVTHKWDIELICKVGNYRNRILDTARKGTYDYLFQVDSDILLHPLTLSHLIGQNKDIISEIFWTRWTPGAKEYPQVWLYDNWIQYEIDFGKYLSNEQIKARTNDFIDKLKEPGVYKVGGLGACTLINRQVINSSISYSRIPNISFPGEDRHFCIRAEALGFDLYVDTNYPAYHIYRKSELSGAQEYKLKCSYKINNL